MKRYTARNRDNLIEQRNQNSLTHLLKDKELTLEQKQFLVQTRNPYIFVFGSNLTPQNDMDYETYINKLYLGETQ